MKKNRIALAIILIILVMTLVACSNTTDATDKSDKDEYIVTIHPNNGDPNVKWDISDPIPKFKKEGFEIEGYYLDSDFTIEVVLTSLKKTGLNGDIDVYIKWKRNGCDHEIVIDEAVPATCTEKGLTEGKHCSKCDEVILAQTEVPALGHTSADAVKENQIAPTCTTAGSCDSVVYCSVCDAEISRETITVDALGHKWIWVVDKNATVTETGLKHEECSVCHIKRNENTSIDSLDCSHQGSLVHHEQVDATCTEDGTIEYWHCTACDKKHTDAAGQIIAETIVIPSTGHTGGKAVQENVVAATCTTAGSYDSVVYCSVCDAELSRETKSVDALGHNIVNHNAQAPTCTEVGWNAYETCSRCDYTTYAEIPATGHSHSAVVTAPTCTEDGHTTYTCHCGDTYVADEADALGHDIVNHEAQAPTCTEVGWNAYETCSRCDYTTYEEIPRAKHTYGDWVEIKPATCTEDGLELRYCICGATETKVIKSTGHSHGATVTYPTCIEEGYTTYTCHCGDTYVVDIVAALGHDTIDHEAQAPTCTEVGWDAYVTCSRCDYTTYAEIPATGHSPAEAVVENNVAPTCIATGGYDSVVYCSVCDAEISRETKTADALGHTYLDDGSCSVCGYQEYIFSLNEDGKSYAITGLSEDFEGTELVIPAEYNGKPVTSIGYEAFRNCYSLTSITIPDSVTSIGKEAFSGCSSLESLTIPFVGAKAGVTGSSKDQYPLGYLFGTSSYTGGVATEQYYYGSSPSSITSTTYYIPSSLKSVTVTGGYITRGAFNNCNNITNITLGDDVTTIGEYAFSYCTSLTSVTIGDSVTSIGDGAFYNCTSLTSVTFGENSKRTTIGEFAFVGCTSLTSIVIPDSVTTISNSVFQGCTSLTDVYYTGDIAGWCGISFSDVHANPMYYADNLYIDGKLVEGELVIPDSVTGIGSYAFYNCTSLTDVYYTGDIAGWCGITFGNVYSNPMYYADNLYIDGKLVEGELIIPDGMTSIPAYAFRGQAITRVTIPNSVTTIGADAFSGCSSLESLTIPFVGAKAGVTSSSTYQYPLGYLFGTSSYTGGVATTQYYYGSSASSTTSTTYYIPSSLKSVTVTGGYIPRGAFYNCNNITNITLGDDVTTIGDYAFYNCTSLTSVTIGDSVTSIGADAFGGCSSLESLTIPFVGAKAGVTSSSINQYPLGYLFGTSSYTGGVATTQYYGSSIVSTTSKTYYIPSSLKSVTVTGGYIPRGAFYNCNNITNITLGDDVTSIGKEAFYNCTSLTDVYYTGTEEQWKNISIGDNAFAYTRATKYYYSETQPPTEGNYWYYDENGNHVVW